MRKFPIAVLVAAGLASFGAQADEAVTAVVADATTVAAAQLDTTVAPVTAASAGAGGMFASKSVVTGLIFAGVSVATFVATTNGDAEGVRIFPPGPEH